MTTNEKRRYGLIAMAVVLMGSVILVVGSALWDGPVPGVSSEESPRDTVSERLESQAGGMKSFGESPWAIRGTPGDRTLEEYYDLRQYPGSPPVIPHPLQSKTDMSIGEECATCHAEGGYVEKLEANAPVTPHPDYQSCKQCHVPQYQTNNYRDYEWKSVSPPKLGQSALGGSPPPMPHDLQMRENCVACHAGPGSVEAIRTDHPDRSNCNQCHVPQRHYNTNGWKRTNDQ